MTTCSTCGKLLHPDSIHTCSPQVGALDERQDRPSKCYLCRYFHRGTESWEMPHIYWYECGKRPANAMLTTFPFRNGCKEFSGLYGALADPMANPTEEVEDEDA